jgi:hypothetical protein
MNEQLMDRFWINQPSTLQPCHSMNGQLVIAPRASTEEKVTVYFRTGEVISALVPRIVLSKGWPKHLQNA